jgi:hypothetical protein
MISAATVLVTVGVGANWFLIPGWGVHLAPHPNLKKMEQVIYEKRKSSSGNYKSNSC